MHTDIYIVYIIKFIVPIIILKNLLSVRYITNKKNVFILPSLLLGFLFIYVDPVFWFILFLFSLKDFKKNFGKAGLLARISSIFVWESLYFFFTFEW